MTICMFKILCVTNRKLCQEEFLDRIDKIAESHAAGTILREKDLAEDEYRRLAEKVLKICKKHQVPCILHSFVDVAIACNVDAIHVPLPVLRRMTLEQKIHFKEIGTSCHSLEDAREAKELGSTYLTAGHIFDTDCKKGTPGRGICFLRTICENIDIPVYAIGGITSKNVAEVQEAGAHGACIMSGLMQCEDIKAYLELFEKEGKEHAVY